jgi:hypothetical protein
MNFMYSHLCDTTLGDPVAEQMLINGGRPVRGIIKHDRRSKKCSLEVAA